MEPVCPGEEVVFVCVEQQSTIRWTVRLQSHTLERTIQQSSVNLGTTLTFSSDPGFGFQITFSGTSTAFNSTLTVTAVRELNGGTVECAGFGGSFTSTIEVLNGWWVQVQWYLPIHCMTYVCRSAFS